MNYASRPLPPPTSTHKYFGTLLTRIVFVHCTDRPSTSLCFSTSPSSPSLMPCASRPPPHPTWYMKFTLFSSLAPPRMLQYSLVASSSVV